MYLFLVHFCIFESFYYILKIIQVKMQNTPDFSIRGVLKFIANRFFYPWPLYDLATTYSPVA